MVTCAGLIAATLITTCVLPQVVAVVRARDASGVSTTAAAQACMSCAAWTAYATSAGMGVAVWSSASGTLLWGVVAVVGVARSGRWPSKWLALCGLLVVVLVVAAGSSALGGLLLTEALATTVPQAWRARTQVRGVSTTTYLMMCVGASSWVVYGAGAGDWPLSASSLLKAAICAYILVLLGAGSRRGRTAGSPCVVLDYDDRLRSNRRLTQRAGPVRAATSASHGLVSRRGAWHGRCPSAVGGEGDLGGQPRSGAAVRRA